MRYMDDSRPARRRSNWGSFVVPVLLGVGVTAGIGALAFNDAPRLLQVPVPKASLQAAPSQPPPHVRPRVVDERSRNITPAAQPFPRNEPPREVIQQTVFTDPNYVPKAAANVVVPSERASIVKKPSRQEVGIVAGIKEAPRVSDHCWPYKQGSIERRNCKMATELNRR